MGTLIGMLLDERLHLTLHELCRETGATADVVIRMVEEGLLEPEGSSPGEWHFPASALARLVTAGRLQQDLGLNLAGAALALDLLDELRALRCRVATLEAMLASDCDDGVNNL